MYSQTRGTATRQQPRNCAPALAIRGPRVTAHDSLLPPQTRTKALGPLTYSVLNLTKSDAISNLHAMLAEALAPYPDCSSPGKKTYIRRCRKVTGCCCFSLVRTELPRKGETRQTHRERAACNKSQRCLALLDGAPMHLVCRELVSGDRYQVRLIRCLRGVARRTLVRLRPVAGGAHGRCAMSATADVTVGAVMADI